MEIIAHFKTDAEKKAFMIGVAFYLGYIAYLKRKLTQDKHISDPEFRTDKQGKPYAIDPNSGETSGLGDKEVKLPPKFNCNEITEFHEKFAKDKGYRATLKSYVLNKFSNQIIDKPKGLPVTDKLKLSRAGLAKTASSIKSDCDWVLPHIADIYLQGEYAGKALPDKGKHPEAKWMHYTNYNINHEGKRYQVRGNVIEKNDGTMEFVHYTVNPITEIK